ncbi:hypothetical protein [Actinotalea solisilvae]|uniref:hypothetical protein n=1 Tax=Actinotalea solisilvae TaxID=2072922 RepID=UPI0018F1B82B|nr:hypothetical protein [Actinotalea solisilvae]
MTLADRALRRLDGVARLRWLILTGCLVVLGVPAALWPGSGDWGFFRTGASGLLGEPVPGTSGGIHLYASMPNVQIGPPALLAAAPFRLLPQPWDVGAARLVMLLAALLVLALVDRAGRAMLVPDVVRRRGILLGGLGLAPSWVVLAVDFAHLDDVLVLVLAASAVLLLATRRPMWAAVALGVAAATKPWAVVLLPLLLVPGLRAGARPLVFAGGVASAWWAPFLADPQTLPQLWSFRLDVGAGSGLTLLGLDVGEATPGWVRPAQVLGGTALGAWAALRGRWTGVILVGLACRVALDPNPLFYYGAGLVLGALVWDVARSARGIPWTTGCAAAALSVAPLLGPPLGVAALRTLTCLGLVLVVVLSLARRPPAATDRSAGPAVSPASRGLQARPS